MANNRLLFALSVLFVYAELIQASPPSSWQTVFAETQATTQAWLGERDCPRLCSSSCECIVASNKLCLRNCGSCLEQGVPCGTNIASNPPANSAEGLRFREVVTAVRPPIVVTKMAGTPLMDPPQSSQTPVNKSDNNQATTKQQWKNKLKQILEMQSQLMDLMEIDRQKTEKDMLLSAPASGAASAFPSTPLYVTGQPDRGFPATPLYATSNTGGFPATPLYLTQQGLSPYASLAMNDFTQRLHQQLGVPRSLMTSAWFPYAHRSHEHLDRLLRHLEDLVDWAKEQRERGSWSEEKEQRIDSLLKRAVRVSRSRDSAVISDAPPPPPPQFTLQQQIALQQQQQMALQQQLALQRFMQPQQVPEGVPMMMPMGGF